MKIAYTENYQLRFHVQEASSMNGGRNVLHWVSEEWIKSSVGVA